MKTYQYRAPNGSLIVAAAGVVECNACIAGFDENGDPDWTGDTDVCWDSQRTKERDGKELYVCEDGEEWTLDQCELIDDEEGASA